MDKPRYKLLKDLPVGKAGDIVFEHNGTICFREDGVICSTGLLADMLCENSWFEEIKESTDSIHWKPEYGEEYWVVNSYGLIVKRIWSDSIEDLNMYRLGIIYSTEEECEKSRDRELAEVRLRRTSTFEPDFKLGCGGYVVYYDHVLCELRAHSLSTIDSGEIVRYETMEDAQRSIRENEQDWLTYFGIREGE